MFVSIKGEHKTIVCKFKIILLKESQVLAFVKSQVFSSLGALGSLQNYEVLLVNFPHHSSLGMSKDKHGSVNDFQGMQLY